MSDTAVLCPKYAWLVLTLIGIIDLARGVIHTFFVEFAATNIAGLNLSVVTQDQLFLLALFGVSNYMTGAIFLLIAFRARHLVPIMLLFVLGLFMLPTIILMAVLQPTAPLSGGGLIGPAYLLLCGITIIVLTVRDRTFLIRSLRGG